MSPRRLWIISWIFKLIPPSRGHVLKARLLRWAGAEIGRNVQIMSRVRVLGDFSLVLGDYCSIGHEALLTGPRGRSIVLEDHVMVGMRTVLVTGSHRFSVDGPCIEKEGVSADIRICGGAAVSTGSIIVPGITVGRMAHVAAGAVVTRDVPEYCRVGGVPARHIRDLRDPR